jgi:hypothetical protein
LVHKKKGENMKKGMYGLVEVLVEKYPGKGFVCINNGDGDEIRDWDPTVERPDDATIETWYDEFDSKRQIKEAKKVVEKESHLTAKNKYSEWDEVKAKIDEAFKDEKQNEIITNLAMLLLLEK